MERFNLKKLKEADVKEKYQATIRNKSATVENIEESGDINNAWYITENIKLFAQEGPAYCKSKHINCGLIRNLQNWMIARSRLNYSGCRPQVK
jgi:hypothetical protein